MYINNMYYSINYIIYIYMYKQHLSKCEYPLSIEV